MKRVPLVLALTMFALIGVAVASDGNHLDLGWREIAYATASVCMVLMTMFLRSMRESQAKLFTCYENHEKRLSRIEGAHEANHRDDRRTHARAGI